MKIRTYYKTRLLILSLFSIVMFGCENTEKQNSVVDKNKTDTEQLTLPGLSVQLWSVQDDAKSDFKGTLRALSDMGFTGVEFAGVFGEFSEDPAKLYSFLKETGLEASGAHVPTAQLQDDMLEETIAFYKAFNCNLLIIPWDDRAWHPENVKSLVAELNALAEKLAPHGMQIGYHNHAEEFQAYTDATYWDYIAQNTSEDVVLQLDAGWVNYAGMDPVDYVQRYPGRTITTHYKIRTPEGVTDLIPLIGQDGFIWRDLLDANVKLGGTKWIVVEQEEYPNGLTPMESVKASKSGLDKVIASYN